jgi:hypothetical protein
LEHRRSAPGWRTATTIAFETHKMQNLILPANLWVDLWVLEVLNVKFINDFNSPAIHVLAAVKTRMSRDIKREAGLRAFTRP